MSGDNEEIYADLLSDIDNDIDSLSDSSDEEFDGSDFELEDVKNVINDPDDENSSDECEWSENDHTPNLHKCMEQSGLQMLSNLNIKSILGLFIGEDLLNLFVRETNLYYCQQNRNKQKEDKTWTDTNITEMKQFLGLIIIMALIKKSEKDEYWSTDPLLCTPIFANIMSRTRFRQIWRYWHFNNNEYCCNRSDKIKPVYTYLTQKFQTVYRPEKELSLYESIIPWRGKSFCHTYNPMKIRKYGILVSMVCEATSGYICNLEMYCEPRKSLKITIFSILSPFLNLWHDVYMDNYCNSTKVVEELLKCNTNICATIRKNKFVMYCLKDYNLKKHPTAFRRKGNILLQTWKTNTKFLSMISTIHSAKMIDCISPKTKKKIAKPSCVIDYYKYMKGGDRADLYLSYYSLLLKTKKWTKKAVLYLLNCALFNAYQVYTKNTKTNAKYKYRKFLLGVASSWLNNTFETNDPSTSLTYIRRSAKYDPVDRMSADMNKHRIIKIVGRGKIKNPRRPCRVCTAAKKKSSTALMCSSCGVPLHIGKCFEDYHVKLKY